MQNYSILYPMFAMVLLAFSVLVMSFRARLATVASGTVHPGYFKTYQNGTEPEASIQLARNFINQFEAPVLFYAACTSALALQLENVAILALAWCYFVLRAIHCYIHTGRNRLKPRILAYFASWVVLLALWVTIIFFANRI